MRRKKKDYSDTPKGQMALLNEYKNRCFVCHKKFGRGFAFHHLWYLKKNEVHYKNYKNSRKYNDDLTILIKRNPKRFLLLCRVHHHYIEWGRNITRKNPEKFLRFIEAVYKTKT
jgi:hypothetical protein